MSTKNEQPSPRSISDQEIRDRLKQALLRFTANAQPAFFSDTATKHLSYRSDFLGFLRLGKYKDEISRILKICTTEPPVEGRYFAASFVRGKDDAVPNAIATLKPGAEWSDVRAEAAAVLDISPTSLITPQAEEIYQWLIKRENIVKRWSSQDLPAIFW